MRVLMVTNLFPTRANPSAATFITSRVEALTACGVDVSPVALSNHYGRLNGWVLGRAGRDVSGADETFGAVDYRRTLWTTLRDRRCPSARVIRALAREVVEAEGGVPDLIHAHGMFVPAAGLVAREVSRLLDRPYLLSVHGTDVNVVLRANEDYLAPGFRDAARVLCVSQALRESVESLLGPLSHAAVVPNGVDPALFAPVSDRDAPRTPVPGDGPPRVLFVGRLEPVKGADRLPAIARAVQRVRPEVVCDVVGAGSLLAGLSEADGLRLHGALPHQKVAELMRSADVLVVPSRSEGWPTVILEAYACGTPVIATDVGGCAEVVRSPTALVEAGDGVVQRLADAVLGQLETPHDGADLRDYALGFTWEEIARREREHYLSVLDRA